jgi:hypothetical protein
MFIVLIITSFGIKISTEVNNISSDRGEFTVEIENNSFFPISTADIRIFYYNKFCPKEYSINGMEIPIAGRNTTKAVFEISSSHCGVISVGVKSVMLNDFFKFWRVKRSVRGEKEFMCLPEIDEFNLDSSFFETENDADKFSEHRSGDDNSEVFDLREYQDGDRMNRVHWKLSTKSDDLIVKEYSFPLDTVNVVLFDFNLSGFDLGEFDAAVAEVYLSRIDKLFYNFFSLCESLAHKDRIKICSFIDGEYEEFFDLDYGYYLNSKPRNAGSDFRNPKMKNLKSKFKNSKSENKLLKYFKAENVGESFSRIYYVCDEIDEETKGEVLSLNSTSKMIFTNDGVKECS